MGSPSSVWKDQLILYQNIVLKPHNSPVKKGQQTGKYFHQNDIVHKIAHSMAAIRKSDQHVDGTALFVD